jgi:nucleotide-binding universal stress UspA family protein
MTDQGNGTTGATAAEETRIVVGVDGSDSALAALRWALRQAKLTGSRVDVVTVWHFPAAYGWEPVGADADFEGDAHQILADALTAVESLRPGVAVARLVEEGPPAEVLLRVAKEADLLVVGSRGRGGLRSALIGSVSLHCIQHAHCPVLVLPEQPAES